MFTRAGVRVQSFSVPWHVLHRVHAACAAGWSRSGDANRIPSCSSWKAAHPSELELHERQVVAGIGRCVWSGIDAVHYPDTSQVFS